MKLKLQIHLQTLKITFFLSGVWSSLAYPQTQTYKFNINPQECSKDLNRVNALSFECHIPNKNAPQRGTWLLSRADQVTQRYGSCTIEASAHLYGYRVKIIKDWHPKRNYFVQKEAVACLNKSIQVGKIDQITLYSVSNLLE